MDKTMLKSTLLLATLIFLIIAPEPDSKAITDMTANLVVAENHAVLLASEKQTESTREKTSQ
jgi:hypothetical protein